MNKQLLCYLLLIGVVLFLVTGCVGQAPASPEDQQADPPQNTAPTASNVSPTTQPPTTTEPLSTPPLINIISPQNETYEVGTNITITYEANKAVVEPDYYILDGGGAFLNRWIVVAKDWRGNVTFTDTVEDLGDGNVKIGIFADNFDDGDLIGWSTAGGAQVVEDGELSQYTAVTEWLSARVGQFTQGVTLQARCIVYDGGIALDCGLGFGPSAWVSGESFFAGYRNAWTEWQMRINDAASDDDPASRALNTYMVAKATKLTTGYNYTATNYTNKVQLVNLVNATNNATSDNYAYLLGSSAIHQHWDDVRVYLPDVLEGNLTSIVKDAESIGQAGDVWKWIKFEGDVPAGTRVSIYVNTSSDGVYWTEYQLIQENAAYGVYYPLPSANQKRYGRWRLVLQTSDPSVTPSIRSVEIDGPLSEVQGVQFENGTTTIVPEEGSHSITIVVMDALGNWGLATRYFTIRDTTPPVISNVQNLSMADTSAVITWTTNEASDSLVKYGTSSGSYTSTPRDVTDITSHSITLSGLTPSTTYYYVVNSTNAKGNSAQSPEYTFVTAEALSSISLVQNSTITATSATLTWTTNKISDSIVKYGTASGIHPQFKLNTTQVTLHNVSLTDLNPKTTYYFVVNSTDASGNSAQSAEYTFMTKTPGVGDTITRGDFLITLDSFTRYTLIKNTMYSQVDLTVKNIGDEISPFKINNAALVDNFGNQYDYRGGIKQSDLFPSVQRKGAIYFKPAIGGEASSVRLIMTINKKIYEFAFDV